MPDVFESVTGRSRAEIGMPETPDESFVLEDSDTIASIRRAHREACAAAREATARELARHCGHADILREQILIRPE